MFALERYERDTKVACEKLENKIDKVEAANKKTRTVRACLYVYLRRTGDCHVLSRCGLFCRRHKARTFRITFCLELVSVLTCSHHIRALEQSANNNEQQHQIEIYCCDVQAIQKCTV